MSFGIFNILTSFQGYINKILVKKLNIFIIVYLNNIFIYIKNPKYAQINVVYCILNILRKNNLFSILKKCCFDKNEVHFLGYIVLVQ